MASLFTRIIRKEIPAEIILEDDNSIAILDVNPLAPGHTLVIPKTEANTIQDLPDNEVGPLFLTVKKITAILDKALSPNGYTIGINHGIHHGIDHLHIHVIPRFKGDGNGSIHTVVSNPPKKSIAEIAEQIRNTHAFS